MGQPDCKLGALQVGALKGGGKIRGELRTFSNFQVLRLKASEVRWNLVLFLKANRGKQRKHFML